MYFIQVGKRKTVVMLPSATRANEIGTRFKRFERANVCGPFPATPTCYSRAEKDIARAVKLLDLVL